MCGECDMPKYRRGEYESWRRWLVNACRFENQFNEPNIMRKTFLIAAATVLSVVACQKEMPVAPEGNYTVRASRESNADTKSTVTDDGVFAWSAGDAIGLWNGKKFCKLTTSVGGSSTADFTGTVEGTAQSYAVFPYSLNANVVESGAVKVTLPANYEWKAGETNSPMLAECGENPTSLEFKHLGGLVKISLKNVPQTAARFVLTADKDISGEYSVATDADGNKIIKSAGAGTSNSVAFTFAAGTATEMAFYVPVPVGEYKFVAALQKEDGTQLWSYGGESTNSVTRAKFIIMPALTLTTIPGTGEGVSTSVTIPANYSGEFALPNTTSDVEVKVEASSQPIKVVYGGESHPGKVSINCGSNVIGNFTIELPYSHVELSGSEYTTLVSRTSLNTLVIANGTKVNTLTVNAGSAVVEGEVASIKVEPTVEEKAKIEVREGGKVSNVENNSTASVVAEESNKPTVSGNGNTAVISPAEYLQNLLQAGGSIVLDRDYTGDFTIPANATVELDLNGHNITNASGDTFTVIGELTISGDGTVDNVSHGRSCIYNNGKVTLNGGTYTRSKETGENPTTSGKNSYYNILNHGELIINEGVTVYQSGAFSSLVANGYFNYTSSDSRSGYVDGINIASPSLTINGGSFSGGINTIKNDDGAILTINGGEFSNTTQACVWNNNIANISGGTFNPSNYYSVASNNWATEYNKGKTTISGGTFNGPLYTYGGGTFEISGGTFNDMSVYMSDKEKDAHGNIIFSSDYELTSPVILKSGALTVDLGGKTLTASSGATIYVNGNGNCITAFDVKNGAKLTVKNGKVGDAEKSIFYGVHSGDGEITLENVEFGEKVTYAVNGGGSLSATGCTFRGWLSGWSKGGSFKDCTFTVGKAYYPAAICYGNTVFESCKFFKNGVDPDEYGDAGKRDEDGFYRCNYVVSACQPTTTIDFNTCNFIDADGNTAALASDNHPYLKGWGDGKTADANIKVDGTAITITSE